MPTVGDVLRVLGAETARWETTVLDRPVRPASLASAGDDALAFATAAAARRPEQLAGLRAALLIAHPDAARHVDVHRVAVVEHDQPRLAFVQVLHALFNPDPPRAGVDPTAVVDPTATVAQSAHVGAHCSVGPRSHVGEDCVLHPGVRLYADVRLGRGVVIHAGSVLGADGFGFERDEAGVLRRFPQLGGVRVEDEAEIGANACIDRGALDDTVIGPRARIDNLVHIGHNVQVGADCAVIAQSQLGGSSVLGEGAWIAPSATVREGLRIGAGALVGLGAVVVKDVEAGVTVAGNPARPLPPRT